jgi:hypothetical protein
MPRFYERKESSLAFPNLRGKDEVNAPIFPFCGAKVARLGEITKKKVKIFEIMVKIVVVGGF